MVVLKGILAGIASGYVYKLLEKFNRYLAVICAGATAVTVNTGIFILGSVLFFEASFAALMSVALLISYLIELFISIVLAPATMRIIAIKQMPKTKKTVEKTETEEENNEK